MSADGRYLTLGKGSAAPVTVEVPHTAVVAYPLVGEEAQRRAAVERYRAESLAHRQGIFDYNGKVLDLVVSGVIGEEEARGLFWHPGVTADPRIPFTSDGKWHAIFPPLPDPPSTDHQQRDPAGAGASGPREPEGEESIHEAFNRFFLLDQDAQRADRG